MFVIDDDAGVVHALRADLGRRFGADFRIVGESTAAGGLAALRRLAEAHEPVALLIVDHQMMDMPGVDFLAWAHRCTPWPSGCSSSSATTAAGRAGHDARAGGLSPHQAVAARTGSLPCDQRVPGRVGQGSRRRLRPLPCRRPAAGPRHPRATGIATRFDVPFRFSPAGGEEGRRLLADRGLDGSRLPVVVRHDDHTIVQPTAAQMIEAVGGTVCRDIDECDVVIVGGGPRGSPPPSMPHLKGCARSCSRRWSRAVRPAAAR